MRTYFRQTLVSANTSDYIAINTFSLGRGFHLNCKIKNVLKHEWVIYIKHIVLVCDFLCVSAKRAVYCEFIAAAPLCEVALCGLNHPSYPGWIRQVLNCLFTTLGLPCGEI